MTATFFLVRHASHDLLGRVLAGRMAGVGLNAQGAREAHAAGRRLAGEELTALFTSPMQRAQETASAIAQACGIAVETAEALNEIDFGDWTGCSFDALRGDRAFADWNERRATARPPAGEAMVCAQRRIVDFMGALQESHPQGRIALVSHGDLLRAAVAHCLGLSLDHLQRFDLEPASITTLVAGDWGTRLITLNEIVREAETARQEARLTNVPGCAA